MPTLMKEKTKANGKMNAKTVHRKYRYRLQTNCQIQLSSSDLSDYFIITDRNDSKKLQR